MFDYIFRTRRPSENILIPKISGITVTLVYITAILAISISQNVHIVTNICIHLSYKYTVYTQINKVQLITDSCIK